MPDATIIIKRKDGKELKIDTDDFGAQCAESFLEHINIIILPKSRGSVTLTVDFDSTSGSVKRTIRSAV